MKASRAESSDQNGPSLSTRLDRLVSIQNSAYERAGSNFRIELERPATGPEIERIEAQVGQRLPDELRTLYSWHDGCSVFLVPGVLYRGSGWSSDAFASICNFRLPALSNAGGERPPGKMLPVFDMDKPLLAVALTPESADSKAPLFYLDFEMDQLTMIARSTGAFIGRLLQELESANFDVTRHGLRWTRDPLALSRSMTPIE